MKRLVLYLGIIGILSGFIWIKPTFATSEKSYQDYLYQFDIYRQRESEFKIARNEYLKFNTLQSETTALEKTKLLLSQRDLLLRAYLLVLNDKLIENEGVSDSERITYQTMIQKEIEFLEQHSLLVNQIGTIDDARDVASKLTSHYDILQSSIRQTIGVILEGSLRVHAQSYEKLIADGRSILSTSKNIFPLQKQNTLERWMNQIMNVRDIYANKIESVHIIREKLEDEDIMTQDSIFQKMRQQLTESKQYLSEGTSYMTELTNALRVSD